MRHICLLVAAVSMFATQHADADSVSQKWNLNDVSIVVPLPESEAQSALMLGMSTPGNEGALVPKPIFDKVPFFLSTIAPDDIYKFSRAVSLRIDPCFHTDTVVPGCLKQIRMVWQPIIKDQEGKLTAHDTSLHTFYDLSEADFNQLLSDLKSLKLRSGFATEGLPLDIHPLIRSQGLAGQYFSDLKVIILKYAGTKTFSRITFMNSGGNTWNFGGFDVVNGQTKPMKIPRINVTRQSFQNNAFPTHDFFRHGAAIPAAEGKDTFNILIQDSEKIAPTDKDEVIESTMSTFRLENPRNHSPNTSDCVSCHTAQMAQIWAIKQYPWYDLEARGLQFRYQSQTSNLKNRSAKPGSTEILRALGYFNRDLAISQRTINESAEVADQLNAREAR